MPQTTLLTLPDGCRLQLTDFAPSASPPGARCRGQILIVHGLGEHAGRYTALARHLAARGWRVTAHDQRGHGGSDGRRGVIPDEASLLADLGAVIAHRRAQAAQGPLLLLGHSLGGLVAGRYVAEGLSPQPAAWWQAVDGLVMSSPALDAGMNAAQKLLLAVLGPLAPNLAVNNGLKPDWICRDAAVVRAYVADPLVHDRIAPRLVRFIVEAGALVRQRAPQWRLPTLLQYAGADGCVAPAGSAAFAAAAPPQWVQSRRYADLAHEIYNEPERAQVLGDLVAWLDAQPDTRPAPAA